MKIEARSQKSEVSPASAAALPRRVESQRSALALLFLLTSVLCSLTSAWAQSAVSTNKTLMVNNGLGGTTNNVLPPSDTNFFDVNFWHLTNALVRGGFSGGGGGGIPTTGTANTVIVYDANGNAVGTNALNGILSGDGGGLTNLNGAALVSPVSQTNLPPNALTNKEASPVSFATNLYVGEN